MKIKLFFDECQGQRRLNNLQENNEIDDGISETTRYCLVSLSTCIARTVCGLCLLK